MVLTKSGGSPARAIAAISAACSAMPRSKAGGKCDGSIRANGGSPNGVSQSWKNGLSVMGLLSYRCRPVSTVEVDPGLRRGDNKVYAMIWSISECPGLKPG